MVESDRKAWVRYAPPRWIWDGTAICGVTGDMSRAILRGWHAQGAPRGAFFHDRAALDDVAAARLR